MFVTKTWMRFLPLLSLLSIPVALAIPTINEQAILGALNGYSDLAGNALSGVVNGAAERLHEFVDTNAKVSKWIEEGKEFVKENNGLVCE